MKCWPLLFILFSLTSFAKDLTPAFESLYKNEVNVEELTAFKENHFILVPGIISESFIKADHSSWLEFSLITHEYFGQQEKFLRRNGFSVTRILPSSKSVQHTRDELIKEIDGAEKKIVFVTHSLGGLALLDVLMARPEYAAKIRGILFLQSPFYGTPVASTFLTYPYHANLWLKPLLPFVNTSIETISYLTPNARKALMETYEKLLPKLDIPIITIAGVANQHASLMNQTITLIERGCLFGRHGNCLTSVINPGPYDHSDGMVPLQSSFLPGRDFVILEGMDHGESVLTLPFTDFDQVGMLKSLLKLLQ